MDQAGRAERCVRHREPFTLSVTLMLDGVLTLFLTFLSIHAFDLVIILNTM